MLRVNTSAQKYQLEKFTLRLYQGVLQFSLYMLSTFLVKFPVEVLCLLLLLKKLQYFKISSI